MALMEWLKKRLAGDETAEIKISEEDNNALSGLNLSQVIEAHMAWKVRLQGTLLGTSNEQLEVAAVAQDNVCTLGKWLYIEGQHHYGHLAEYEELRKTHADFHLCAGQVLIEFHDSNIESATQLLRGKFRSLSDLIQLDLVRLFAAAKQAKTS